MASSISPTSEMKGFLYNIYDSNNVRVGHLFGTIHEFRKCDGPLNSKIFALLAQSKGLFLELNIFDENLLTDHLKNNPTPEERRLIKNLSQEATVSEDQAIRDIVRISIETLRRNADSIEAVLALKAQDLGIEIQSLETGVSRASALQRVKDDFIDLELKRCFFVAIHLKSCADHLDQIAKNLSANNLTAAVESFTMGSEMIAEAILLSDSILMDGISVPNARSIELGFGLVGLINSYDKIAAAFGVEGRLHDVFLAHKAKKGTELEKLKLAWAAGNEKEVSQFLESTSTPVEIRASECINKFAYLRDGEMVDKIHAELERSLQSGERKFYAVGAAHLIGKYQNLIQRLKQKGWKFTNAYEEE